MIMPLLRRGFRRAGFRGIDDVALARTVRMVAAALASDHDENARAMTQPCLVAHAEDDALVEVEIARELAAVVPDGPRLWFDSGGHALPKTRAVPIAQALIDWYPSLLPRTRANKA
jgi:pimeloyl-ACP methyl ester carboxylesterase